VKVSLGAVLANSLVTQPGLAVRATQARSRSLERARALYLGSFIAIDHIRFVVSATTVRESLPSLDQRSPSPLTRLAQIPNIRFH
jgi:hypothetical protein